MSINDQNRLQEQVAHIVNNIENGYYSKDNLEVDCEDGTYRIWNSEKCEVFEDMTFETEEEAKAYLDTCQGESIDGLDYLSDALDIEYVVNSKKEYLGARVLVAFGGPNIWINTRTKQVEGYWWGDKSIQSYTNDSLNLDDALETLYTC
jgi:hypothetical protein